MYRSDGSRSNEMRPFPAPDGVGTNGVVAEVPRFPSQFFVEKLWQNRASRRISFWTVRQHVCIKYSKLQLVNGAQKCP